MVVGNGVWWCMVMVMVMVGGDSGCWWVVVMVTVGGDGADGGICWLSSGYSRFWGD